MLRWEGKLHWEGDSPDAAATAATADPADNTPVLGAAPGSVLRTGAAAPSSAVQAHEPTRKRRDAGR